jgi:hypothetical protein
MRLEHTKSVCHSLIKASLYNQTENSCRFGDLCPVSPRDCGEIYP